MEPKRIMIYTDGAAQNNPGPGGYGAVLVYNQHRRELSEGFRLTTNNRMELLAVIRGLQALKEDNLEITVVSDSKYVTEAINQKWIIGWQKKNFKDRKNPDLWQELIPLLKKYKVVFEWVKGHNGHTENERCDCLAVAAAQGKNLPPDEGYENSLKTAASERLL